MSHRQITVTSSEGLHARPAGALVQLASTATVPVTIGRAGEPPVDAASILDVMMLGASQGDELVLTAEGDGADDLLDAMVAAFTASS